VLSSPMAIGIPAGAEDPIVLDMATGFGGDAPKQIFKNLGMQAAVVALGGVIAGVYSPELLPGATEFEANQGCMIIVLDASKFLPAEVYRSSMDRFIGAAKDLGPIADIQTHAEFPGGDQARRIRHCEEFGIAMEPHHLGTLVELADELKVPVPAGWRGVPGAKL
jgi:LDH2 family malate/lactate/ureidoglycolate dehydrogenase